MSVASRHSSVPFTVSKNKLVAVELSSSVAVIVISAVPGCVPPLTEKVGLGGGAMNKIAEVGETLLSDEDPEKVHTPKPEERRGRDIGSVARLTVVAAKGRLPRAGRIATSD